MDLGPKEVPQPEVFDAGNVSKLRGGRGLGSTTGFWIAQPYFYYSNTVAASLSSLKVLHFVSFC